MSSIISNLLSSKDHLVANVLFIVFSVNAGLTAVKLGLDKLQQRFPSDLENKASAVIGKVLGVLSHVVGFITANKQYLPPESQGEAK